MKKKIVFITSSLPNTYKGGGVLTAYSMLKAFSGRGFSIALISWSTYSASEEERMLADLGKIVSEVMLLKEKTVRRPEGLIARLLRGCTIEDILPQTEYKEEVISAIRRVSPQAIIGYHWESMAALIGYSEYPKCVLLGDPLNLPSLYRSRHGFKHAPLVSLKNIFKDMVLRRQTRSKQVMSQIFSSVDRVGAFAAHHAKDMSDEFSVDCRYVCTPVPQPEQRYFPENVYGNKVKLALVGHLKGIATLSGIELFFLKVLPLLKADSVSKDIEVHVIGGFFDSLPKHIKTMMEDPMVKIPGHIDPIMPELLSSYALIVPTPIELGIRVRIITALSYGLPVVAHSANAMGIPELIDGDNSLLASDAAGLAKKIKLIIQDKELHRSISHNALKTYKDRFSIETAGSRIVEMADGIIA